MEVTVTCTVCKNDRHCFFSTLRLIFLEPGSFMFSTNLVWFSRAAIHISRKIKIENFQNKFQACINITLSKRQQVKSGLYTIAALL